MNLFTIVSRASFTGKTHLEAIADFSGTLGATIVLSGVVYFTGGAARGGKLSYSTYSSYKSKSMVLAVRNSLYGLTYNTIASSYKYIDNITSSPLDTILSPKTNLQLFGKFSGLDIAEALSIDPHKFNWNSRQAFASYVFKTSLEVTGTIIGTTLGTITDSALSGSLDTEELWNTTYSIPKTFGSNYVIDIVTRLPSQPLLNSVFNRLSNTVVLNSMYTLIRPIFNSQYINLIINNVNFDPPKEMIGSYSSAILDELNFEDIAETLNALKAYKIDFLSMFEPEDFTEKAFYMTSKDEKLGFTKIKEERLDTCINSKSKKIIDNKAITEKLKKFEAFIAKAHYKLLSLDTTINIEYFFKQLESYEQEIQYFKKELVVFAKDNNEGIIKKIQDIATLIATKKQEIERALLNQAKNILDRLLLDINGSITEKLNKIARLKKELIVQDFDVTVTDRASDKVIEAAIALGLDKKTITLGFINKFLQPEIDKEYERLRAIKEQAEQLIATSQSLPNNPNEELKEFYYDAINKKATEDQLRRNIQEKNGALEELTKTVAEGSNPLKDKLASNNPKITHKQEQENKEQQKQQNNEESLIQKIQKAKHIEELILIINHLYGEQPANISTVIVDKCIEFLNIINNNKNLQELMLLEKNTMNYIINKQLLKSNDRARLQVAAIPVFSSMIGRGGVSR